MDTGSQLPTYLTDLQVSDWIGVPVGKVRRWAKSGELPCLVLPDGSRLFDPDNVIQWLRSLSRPAIPGKPEGANV